MSKIIILIATLTVIIQFCDGQKVLPNANTRNLVLNEQELRFAGIALRTVLSSNVNAYVSATLQQSFICFNAKNMYLEAWPRQSKIQWNFYNCRKCRVRGIGYSHQC